jgi:hypothetical protein
MMRKAIHRIMKLRAQVLMEITRFLLVIKRRVLILVEWTLLNWVGAGKKLMTVEEPRGKRRIREIMNQEETPKWHSNVDDIDIIVDLTEFVTTN